MSCLAELSSNRPSPPSANDLLLASMIGVETAETALQICADFYPDEPIPPRTAAVLRELFGDPQPSSLK